MRVLLMKPGRGFQSCVARRHNLPMCIERDVNGYSCHLGEGPKVGSYRHSLHCDWRYHQLISGNPREIVLKIGELRAAYHTVGLSSRHVSPATPHRTNGQWGVIPPNHSALDVHIHDIHHLRLRRGQRSSASRVLSVYELHSIHQSVRRLSNVSLTA